MHFVPRNTELAVSLLGICDLIVSRRVYSGQPKAFEEKRNNVG